MNRYPLIKIAIVFIIGILLSKLITVSIVSLFCILLAVFLIAVLLFFFKFYQSSTVFVYILFILLGLSYISIRNLENRPYPFDDEKIKNVKISGEISNIDLMQKEKISLEIDVDSVSINGNNISLPIRVLARIFDNNLDSLYEKLSIGNSVRVVGIFQKGRNARNPGEFDYQSYLEEMGISALINIYDKSDFEIISDDKSIFPQKIFEIRKGINEKLKVGHTQKAYSLLRGLILADRKMIDYETRNDFVNSGVVHILAVSGLHVGYILLIFLFLLNRTNIMLRVFLTMLGLLIFLLLTNSPPSVFRATIMTFVGLSAFILNREYNGINALSIAAIILLIINPNELFSPGFQLSFSAVASILLIYPKFSNLLNNLKINSVLKKILLFAAVSLAAQIGTLPFTLFFFGKLSIISLFANILVIPAIGMILPLGIITLISGIIIPWFGLIYASANNLFIELLFSLINLFSKIPMAFIDIINFSVYDGILFYLFTIFFFTTVFARLSIKARIIVSVLVVFNYFIYTKLDNHYILKENLLTIIYIDVDQGDSFLIRFPNGKTALIDAGNATEYFDSGENIIKPLMKNLDIEKINYAFLSHLDADHYFGIFNLIENDLVDTIYKPSTDTSVSKESDFLKYLNEKAIPYIDYHKEIKRIGNASLYILNDSTDMRSADFDSNNKSGVIKIVYGNNSFLFMGDSETPAEGFLISKFNKFLDSEVLKLGHHGSKTSSSEKFLDIVTPEYGIISAGIKNRFNHPSKSILERLKMKNINYKRTDKEGAIILQSDGENYKFIDWRNFNTFALFN